MANWAYIENGQVVESYDNLPINWRNISNFHALKNDVEYLASLNWVPVIHPEYKYNAATQRLDNPRFIVEGNIVTEVYDIVEVDRQSLTIFDIEKMLLTETQNKLDTFAKTRGYENILSACSYVNDSNTTFHQDATYCIQARSQTWSALFQIINDIKSGIRPKPNSFFEIENQLPVLNWPE